MVVGLIAIALFFSFWLPPHYQFVSFRYACVIFRPHPLWRAGCAPCGADLASSLLRQTAPTAAFDSSRPNQRKSRPLHWIGADRPAARPQLRADKFLLVSGRAPWYPEPSGSAASFAKETKGKAAGHPAARGHDQRIRPKPRPCWNRRRRGGLSCPMAAPQTFSGQDARALSFVPSASLYFLLKRSRPVHGHNWHYGLRQRPSVATLGAVQGQRPLPSVKFKRALLTFLAL